MTNQTTNNNTTMVKEEERIMNKSRVTIKDIAGLLAQSTATVLAEVSAIRLDVTGIKTDIVSIKTELENIRKVIAPTAAERAIQEGRVVCQCGKAMSKGEVDYCKTHGLEFSCYKCRTKVKAPVVSATEPAVTDPNKPTIHTPRVYKGKCKHEFKMSPVKYTEYISKCRELNVPVLLCPTCAKKALELSRVKPETPEVNGNTQSF